MKFIQVVEVPARHSGDSQVEHGAIKGNKTDEEGDPSGMDKSRQKEVNWILTFKDQKKAMALLDEAGVSNLQTKIWAMPVQRPYNPNARRIAEIVQAQLAEVGVDIEIVSYDWGTYLDKVDAGEHMMGMLGWTGDNGDPDNFSGYFFANCNEPQEGYFDFPEICDILTEAGALVDRRQPDVSAAGQPAQRHFLQL